jgi:hypothetical protein
MAKAKVKTGGGRKDMIPWRHQSKETDPEPSPASSWNSLNFDYLLKKEPLELSIDTQSFRKKNQPVIFFENII